MAERADASNSRARPGLTAPVVERLIEYRRNLRRWLADGRTRIYSHELAALASITSVLVRRDLMMIEYTGSPARGYDVAGLIERIDKVLNAARGQRIVLVGVGSLGRAILKHLGRIHPELRIVAAFDTAAEKVGRVIDNCRCYDVAELETVVEQQRAAIGIIAVPEQAAQTVARRLVQAGVRGILNFSPARLRLPPVVYVEDVDIAVSLEKVVFFAQPEAETWEARA